MPHPTETATPETIGEGGAAGAPFDPTTDPVVARRLQQVVREQAQKKLDKQLGQLQQPRSSGDKWWENYHKYEPPKTPNTFVPTFSGGNRIDAEMADIYNDTPKGKNTPEQFIQRTRDARRYASEKFFEQLGPAGAGMAAGAAIGGPAGALVGLGAGALTSLAQDKA